LGACCWVPQTAFAQSQAATAALTGCASDLSGARILPGAEVQGRETHTSDLSQVLSPSAIHQLPTLSQHPTTLIVLGVTVSYITGQRQDGSQSTSSNNSLDHSGRVHCGPSVASYSYFGNDSLYERTYYRSDHPLNTHLTCV